MGTIRLSSCRFVRRTSRPCGSYIAPLRASQSHEADVVRVAFCRSKDGYFNSTWSEQQQSLSLSGDSCSSSTSSFSPSGLTCRTPVQADRNENLLSLAQRIGGLVRAGDDDLCLEGVCARCEMVVDGELVRACVHTLATQARNIPLSPSSASTHGNGPSVVVEILPMIEDCDAWLEYERIATTREEEEAHAQALTSSIPSSVPTSRDAFTHANDTSTATNNDDDDDLSLFV